MKNLQKNRTRRLAVGVALSVPMWGFAAHGTPQDSQRARSQSHESTVTQSAPRPRAATSLITAQANPNKKTQRRKPIYRPPRMGAPAPGNRVGGGTRGSGASLPTLVVLAPEHTGHTMNPEPTLYWFVTEVGSEAPMFFTLIESNSISPVVETRIPTPTTPGIQRVRLADYGVRLKVGHSYDWSIALVPDSEHRSRDVVAMGGIKLVDPSETVSAQLSGHAEQEAPFIYAEAGLWYDAIEAISDLIDRAPANREFLELRAALLEQVELTDLMAHEASAAENKAS